jgi:hypothetical protein
VLASKEDTSNEMTSSEEFWRVRRDLDTWLISRLAPHAKLRYRNLSTKELRVVQVS